MKREEMGIRYTDKLGSEGKRLISFACFYGVKTLTMANFTVPTVSELAYGTGGMVQW
jgi:hypothetical protein